MDSIPHELIGQIFLNLSIEKLSQMRLINNRFNKIITSDWYTKINKNSRIVKDITKSTNIFRIINRLSNYNCPYVLDNIFCKFWMNFYKNKFDLSTVEIQHNQYTKLFTISIEKSVINGCIENIKFLEKINLNFWKLFKHNYNDYYYYNYNEYNSDEDSAEDSDEELDELTRNNVNKIIEYGLDNSTDNICIDKKFIKDLIESGNLYIIKLIGNHDKCYYCYHQLLSVCISNNNIDIYRILLDECNINIGNRSTYVLSWAVYKGNYHTIKYIEYKHQNNIKWYGGMYGAIRSDNMNWFWYFYNKAIDDKQLIPFYELQRFSLKYGCKYNFYNLLKALKEYK